MRVEYDVDSGRKIAMAQTGTASSELSAATIRTKGILHFTIGVRDHLSAAKFYSELLGCRIIRSGPRYSFMECGGSFFVLAKMPHHVNPNAPGEDAHHHAFIVASEDFDRSLEILAARGIEIIKYSEEGHVTFPGRHAYFHDADGNCLELIDLYEINVG
jgi:catechol 2,3-dioxygenase-like lactoylglutathione lyase family enzyme